MKKMFKIVAASICLISVAGCKPEAPVSSADAEIKERLSHGFSKEEIKKRYDFVQSDMKGRSVGGRHY